MVTLDKEKIIDVIWGATLYGGGGGGSMQGGLDLLERYEKDHPGKEIGLDLLSPAEMESGRYAAVTAGMGAPTALKGIDFSPYATNAYNALKEYASKLADPKDLAYSMAVELGGFNTFVPMMISLLNDIPFVDSDGAARAVPALDALLLHVNGLDTSPLAMANADNDIVNIALSDPRNAGLAEVIGRHICIAFGMMSGLSGWILSAEDVKRLPDGSVSKCRTVGKTLRANAQSGKPADPFALLAKAGIECRPVMEGRLRIKEVKAELVDGFDIGEIRLEHGGGPGCSPGCGVTVLFQNENLIVKIGDSNIMTVPDIISMVDCATGEPLTNADVKEGIDIFLGLMKVDKAWWINPDMFDSWTPYLKRVGYEGPNIPYPGI